MKTQRALMGGILAGCLVLAGCGGGGDDERCSTLGAFSVSAQWNSNGSINSGIVGKLGVPLTATPVITGLPESCKTSMEFSRIGGGALFPGLTLNPTSGVISGTPTQAAQVSGQLVQMSVKGYSAVPVLTNIRITQ